MSANQRTLIVAILKMQRSEERETRRKNKSQQDSHSHLFIVLIFWHTQFCHDQNCIPVTKASVRESAGESASCISSVEMLVRLSKRSHCAAKSNSITQFRWCTIRSHSHTRLFDSIWNVAFLHVIKMNSFETYFDVWTANKQQLFNLLDFVCVHTTHCIALAGLNGWQALKSANSDSVKLTFNRHTGRASFIFLVVVVSCSLTRAMYDEQNDETRKREKKV